MTERARWQAVVLLVLAALGVLAVLAVAPPSARPVDAPAEEFSAARAAEHVRQIAQRPHPLGTEDSVRVREYIVAAAREAGAEVRVESGEAVAIDDGNPFASAEAHNVIALLPGSQSQASGGKALLVAAHYDSVPTGPGAADDGAAVAAMLETMRALRARGGVRNDVLFLFTDGEELGLLGAELYVARHGLGEVGAVLNWEARGSRGPVWMFQTGQGNHPLVRAFAAASPRPVANSLTGEVYRRLPNDTDFTVFLRGGATGLNAAFLEGLHEYHSAFDTPERLSADSMQHHGESMLGLVTELGDTDLRTLTGGDAVYFDVFARMVVHYPAAWAIPLGLVTALGLVVLVVYGARRRALRLAGVLAVAGVGIVAVFAAAVASFALWQAVLLLRPDLSALPLSEPYEQAGFAAGFTTVALAVLLATAGLLRRRGTAELLAGGLVLLALLLVACVFTLPGASYLLQWPVLLGLPALWWAARHGGVPGGDGAPGAGAARGGDGTSGGDVPGGGGARGGDGTSGGDVPGGSDVPGGGDVPGGDVPRGGGAPGAVGLVLAALAPAAAVVLFAPLVDNLLVALGIPLAAVAAVVAVLGGLVLLPLLAALPRPGLLAGVALVAAVGVLGVSVADSGFAPGEPRPNALVYVRDVADGAAATKALWLTGDPRSDAWTAKALGDRPAAAGDEDAATYLPEFADRRLLTAPAPDVDLPPPTVELLADTPAGDGRTVRFRVASARGAWKLQVRLPVEPLRECTIGGRRLDRATLATKADKTDGVVFQHFGAPDGVEISCEVDAGARLPVEVSDHTIGLPAQIAALVGPRSEGMVPVSYGIGPSDSSVVRRLVTM